jgi:CRP/FNR family transcriptional regulator
VLYASDQPAKLSLIMAGFVKRYFIAYSGNFGIQVINGPGDIFPLTVIYKTLFNQDIYQGPETYYYEAMTDVSMYAVNETTLRQEVLLNPDLYRALLQKTGDRFYSNIQFLENLRLHGAYAKTAHQLAYFGQHFGKRTEAGIRIQLPLTHQDIADSIGTTRETTTAAIIKLRSKKIIHTNQAIIILDFAALISEAYS